MKRCVTLRAAWGANPADIKFTSVSRREGNAAEFLASARQQKQWKEIDPETAARMAVSVGSPEYYGNKDVDPDSLHVNKRTGEVRLITVFLISITELILNLFIVCRDIRTKKNKTGERIPWTRTDEVW